MKRIIRLGITIGDINGIGPEIALQAAHRRWPSNLRLLLVGSGNVLNPLAAKMGYPEMPVWTGGKRDWAKVQVWEPERIPRLKRNPGSISRPAARAAASWIRHATSAAHDGFLQGIVTAPINKEALWKAGVRYPGHTEMIADLCGVRRYAMMLMGKKLRVVLVTRHIPLKKVAGALTSANIFETISITAESLRWMGKARGPIAVCGLNPHAGDGGAIGREEIRVINPAVRKAQRAGLPVEGPLPADTVFYQAVNGAYEAVVCMYHDQGLGPLKMISFDHGVNLTLGLPFVRTSPDHGTAMDIAGTGKADPSSMVEAIKTAYRLASRKNPWKNG